MNDSNDFALAFESLTGNEPFPWQTDLYENWFMQGKIPDVCDIPTGLGKTSVIAVWLIARANGAKLPRRLVYVVNRRTVVDQTTDEITKLRNRLINPEEQDLSPKQLTSLKALAESLVELSGMKSETPLAISTLRGQFADNQEWSADPTRPAVICGTVDMIGSRLLFSGYRIGFKSRPLHAGFLGQDALLVHDEAHLEPAFQTLIETIEREQREREKTGELPWPKLQVMALSATARSDDEERRGDNNGRFDLTEEERKPPETIPEDPTEPIHYVWRRLKAKKTLSFHEVDDSKGAIAKSIAQIAEEKYRDANATVLIFSRTLNDVEAIVKQLKKTEREVLPLTGTMRGKERDEFVEKEGFRRFQNDKMTGETVYLVCTSAGEVGINISAGHMVCDLSTLDSMAQRFGRVNRFGNCNDTSIDVVYSRQYPESDKLTPALRATLAHLRNLTTIADNKYDTSPLSLMKLELDASQREAAFAPPPRFLPATDILFDAWALTTVRDKIPGRPPVEPYLHGVAEWEPPRTSVAWREEVWRITDRLIAHHGKKYLQNLLEDYPLKPHELLSDTTERVYKQLQQLIAEPKASVKGEKRQNALQRAQSNAAVNIWLIDDNGAVNVVRLGDLLSKEKKQVSGLIADSTILLAPSVGGLADGMLDGTSELADDVADITDGPDQRIRIHPDVPGDEATMAKTANMRRVRSIELPGGDDEDDEPRLWEWYESLPLEGGRTAKKPVLWQTHVDDVVENAKRIVPALQLPQEIADAVILAAELHDHGKRRERFQTTLGNRRFPDVLWAKSGKRGARLPEPFRHEFGSVLDCLANDAFDNLDDEIKDLVLHVIAAHHGRARPHFSRDESFDPERPSSDAEALAIETPRRFARLQRKYGRWGLAYLESLLRAADWDASANPSAYVDETEDKT